MPKNLVRMEYLVSVVLCLILGADVLRRSFKRPTDKQVGIAIMVLLAGGVVFALFGPFILFFLVYMIPLYLQKVVLAIGLAFGINGTIEARRTGSKERWVFAVIAWAAFLLMADYCLTTGSLSYSVD